MYRSTKGASKARRDQINAEIRNLKELLPLAEADKVRLSYLHIMSLACIYTRKGVFFTGGERTGAARNRSGRTPGQWGPGSPRGLPRVRGTQLASRGEKGLGGPRTSDSSSRAPSRPHRSLGEG